MLNFKDLSEKPFDHLKYSSVFKNNDKITIFNLNDPSNVINATIEQLLHTIYNHQKNFLKSK